MTMPMTRVRNHGVPNMRDHGVFNTDAVASVIDLQTEREQLQAALAELQPRLKPLADKLETGDATENDLILAQELGLQYRRINGRLQQVNLSLRAVEEKEAQAETDRRRRAFDRLVMEAPAKRAEFIAKHRELCLLLGEICSDVDQAVELGNQLSILSVTGMMPVDRAALEKMGEPLDPMESLLNECEPTTKFGWNWRISVPALRKKGA